MKVKIVLGLQKKSHAELITVAELYASNMTGDPIFSGADFTAQVTALKTAITAMRTAMNAPLSDTKTEGIRMARVQVEHLVNKLASRVEDLANDPATPDANRMNIVDSAGMTVKDSPKPQKRKFCAEFGEVSGSVILYAPGGAKAHEWEYTTDPLGISNRKRLEPTTMGRAEVFDLIRGTEYAFFHKAIVSGEKTDWEGPVKFMVV